MAEKSNMTAEWLQRVWEKYPNKLNNNGTITTGPVRTAFCNLLDRGKNKDGTLRAYGAVLLFPDHRVIKAVNLDVLMKPVKAMLLDKAPLALENPTVRAKYHDPFKKQDTFIDSETGELYDGFVAGRYAISANSSQTQPPVVDQKLAPIIDKSKVYSGCWVLANLNPGWINRDDKKGPTFYLNTVMVVAEDENLGGVGKVNPRDAFAGVNIEAGDINADKAFGESEKAVAGEPDIWS